MKIRQGFVSNSSSSSFLIVGVSAHRSGVKERVKELMEKDGCNEDEMGYGVGEGRNFMYYGGYEIDYIGLDAEKMLMKDMTVSEIRTEFIKRANKLGWTPNPKDIELYYGESSSE